MDILLDHKKKYKLKKVNLWLTITYGEKGRCVHVYDDNVHAN